MTTYKLTEKKTLRNLPSETITQCTNVINKNVFIFEAFIVFFFILNKNHFRMEFFFEETCETSN